MTRVYTKLSAPDDPLSILDRLENVKQRGPDRWLARCPAHADKSPSLSIRELSDGRILLHCFSGCTVHDVVAAVGLELRDLFPKNALHDGAQPSRRPFPAMDALRALVLEVRIAALAASDMAAGKTLSANDRKRLQVAAARLSEALLYVEGGRHYA